MKIVNKIALVLHIPALWICALVLSATSAFGQTSLIVPTLPTQTAPDNYSTLLYQQLRLQDVYGASYFSNGIVSIYEIHFQRKLGTAPFTNITLNIRVALSTTTKNPDSLSSTFSNNVGTNEVVVFNGPIVLSSPGAVTSNPATSPFDIVIPFTTPFTYDPSKGNLLVDFKQASGSIPGGVLGIGSASDNASRVFAYNSTDTVGGIDSGADNLQLITSPSSNNSDITIFPNGGAFTNSVQVTISTRLGSGQIRYTTDGTDPTTSSSLFTNSFQVTETSTVKARFFINGFPASDVFNATFNKVNPILFNPGSGLFTNSLQVTLFNSLGSGVIRYTVDGTAPTVSSTLYSGPIQITDARTISARIFLNNFPISDVYATNYSRVYALSNDGITAAWRQQYFGPGYLTDPRVAADADPDNDGSTNLQEFTAGTNPLDPGSGFKISFRAIPLLSWTTIVNSNYTVLRRTNLNSGSFVPVLTLKATNTTTTFIDVQAGDASSQFYYSIQLVP